MENIKLKTIELINDLKNNNLTKSNLKTYYRMVINNFNQIINFDDYSDYRFSGAIFGVMLEIDDFEDDPDIRQSMASIGFYILSKGMEKFCLDHNNHFKSDKSIEQIELISSRISLLLESNASIKYSLRLSKPNTNPYYTPLMDNYREESNDYSDIILCDSYSVKYLCSKPGNALFMNESLNFANQTYERFADYGNIQERVENGRNSQIRLYEFLKKRFENDKEFTFE
jgi:hypothetical protein